MPMVAFTPSRLDVTKLIKYCEAKNKKEIANFLCSLK